MTICALQKKQSNFLEAKVQLLRSLCSFAIILGFSNSLCSQNSTIRGDAKFYKGSEISAVTYDDYITHTEKILSTSMVNDSGFFQLKFNAEKNKLCRFKK